MTMAYSKVLFVLLAIWLQAWYSIAAQPLLLPLTHSLSKNQNTKFGHHLLKSTATISAARHRRHTKKERGGKHQVSLPLSPGSDYTLNFSLNSQTLSVYMDTGSDMVWFPCSPFECMLCEGKYPFPYPYPYLNVSKSSLLSCKSHACSAAHSSLPSSDLCAIARCPLDELETSDCSGFGCPPFYYAYGDGSLIAQLHMENMLIPSASSSKPLKLENFTFGCANSALGEPVGVAGFGRGSLSLPAQLAPELGNQFSYCLVSHSFDSTKLRHPSPLILGKELQVDGDEVAKFVYTPMLENPKHPYFYSVGLEGISVGRRLIPAPEKLKIIDRRGNGGVVVDSGTTYTMLPTKLYISVAAELDRQVGRVFKRATETESRTGMNPCFYLHSQQNSTTSSFHHSKGKFELSSLVPSLVLHFGRNSSVVLPRRNFLYDFVDDGMKKKEVKVACFMMMDGGDESDGPAATLGNYQQQGFHVVYDLSRRRVGFARRECATMWNNLNNS